MNFKFISLSLALALAATPVMAAENQTNQTSQNDTLAQSAKANDSKNDQDARRALVITGVVSIAIATSLLLGTVINLSQRLNELQTLTLKNNGPAVAVYLRKKLKPEELSSQEEFIANLAKSGSLTDTEEARLVYLLLADPSYYIH